jgi:hypothetical protein
MLPNAYHDLSLRHQRSWKEHRGTQRRAELQPSNPQPSVLVGEARRGLSREANAYTVYKEIDRNLIAVQMRRLRLEADFVTKSRPRRVIPRRGSRPRAAALLDRASRVCRSGERTG